MQNTLYRRVFQLQRILVDLAVFHNDADGFGALRRRRRVKPFFIGLWKS